MKTTGKIIIFIFTLWALIANACAAEDSPLHKAVQKGDKALVESLLSKGADANAKNTDGETPLHYAAYFGMNDIIELLLDKGANIAAMSNQATPLHFAVDAARTDTVELLLTKGADINVKDIFGGTPLHHAAIFGNKDVAEFLLAKGADINAKKTNGETPQDQAARLGRKDVAVLLEEHTVNRAKQAGRAENQIKSNPRAALFELMAQFKGNPTDDTRRLIIKLGAETKPAPAIPEEAARRMARGAAAFKGAVSAADYQDAAREFEQATLAAPWYGDAYFNLGVAQDKAGNYEAALHSLKLAQLASHDSKEIKALIYEVEYRHEKVSSPAAQAAKQKQNDDELVHSLDGVRFDSPASQLMAGSSELNEHWVVINGSQLTSWDKVIQADPDLASANPREHALGVVSRWSLPIVGTLARGDGGNSFITFRITSDRIFMDSAGKLFRTYSRR